MNGIAEYEEFLGQKVAFEKSFGFRVNPFELHSVLKPHQRDIVAWAIEGGRRAIFARFGLGKSVMQMETLRQIIKREGGRALIVAPLGVRGEFIRDGRELLGIEVRFVRRTEEVDPEWSGIYVTNYESVRDGKLDVDLFTAVSLDEASVLRSFGSKTYQEFLGLFDTVKYRFVATATPSPNRYKELIHYAGFLGVMDTGQALTRFFQRDSTSAGNLTLYPHKEREFWLWLNTWACFLQRPSDLGHSDEGYDLPSLTKHWEEVAVDLASEQMDRDGQGVLVRGAKMSMVDAAREKRDTLTARVARVMEIVDEHVLRTESGSATGGAEGTRRGAGSGEASGVPAGVLREEPRAVAGSAAGAWSEELSGEAGNVRGASSEDAAEGVRSDAGGVLGDADGSGGSLRDLRRDGRSDAGGSRPRNGSGAGDSLHLVQHSVGAVQGEPGDDAAGDRVSSQIIIWCDLNDEQRTLELALEARGLTYSSVHGGLSDVEAENRLDDWRDGRTFALIGKPVMLGQGMNLQQCQTAVFVGITHKFEQTIQAVHRIHRYGQNRECHVYLIHADTEGSVRDTLEQKWDEHERLAETMSDVIREYGLNPGRITAELTRSMGVQRAEAAGEDWLIAHNDCVPETMGMDENSVDLIVTSIPFSNHYEYTPSYNDFGHTDGNDHFWAQMDFLTPQLHRILKPGRIYACHVKDRILFGNVTGAGIPTVSPFHAEALFHGMRHGFDYMGMITVTTDVVRENNQTYRLGYTEMRKDGSKMGVGSPEYILLFHKPQTDRSKGYADERIVKGIEDYSLARWQIDAAADWRSSGNRVLSVDELAKLKPEDRSRLFSEQSLRTTYDFNAHVALGEALQARRALPSTFKSLDPGSWHPFVWSDVNRMLTLNGEQARRNLEFHICPLQFDIVDRLIERYSNRGDLVFDPFGGLGTVPLRARKLGRKGRAVELNPTSFRDAVNYQREMDRSGETPSLFDLLDLEGAA